MLARRPSGVRPPPLISSPRRVLGRMNTPEAHPVPRRDLLGVDRATLQRLRCLHHIRESCTSPDVRRLVLPLRADFSGKVGPKTCFWGSGSAGNMPNSTISCVAKKFPSGLSLRSARIKTACKDLAFLGKTELHPGWAGLILCFTGNLRLDKGFDQKFRARPTFWSKNETRKSYGYY